MKDKKQIKVKRRIVCRFARLSMLPVDERCSVCFLRGTSW